MEVLHWLRQCSKIPAGVPPAANMLRSSILLCTAGRRPAKQNEGSFMWLVELGGGPPDHQNIVPFK